MKLTLAICGLGGSGRELLDLADRVNDGIWDDIVFIDKEVNEKARIFREKKVYTFEEITGLYGNNAIEFIISVGDVYLREKIYKQIKSAGYRLTTIVAPGVYIPNSTVLGEGVIVRDYCFVSVDAHINDNVMIQPCSIIGHDVLVRENTIISAHCNVSGAVTIGRNTYIGMNSGIKECVCVGSDCIVSMGSIVNKNIEDRVIVRGNPADVVAANYIGSAFRFNTGDTRSISEENG